MAKADRQKWDAKYASQSRLVPNPPAALIDNIAYLKTGKVLDVACGEGAVALYLAALSQFSVTAIDISAQGLRNLQTFAQQQQLTINDVCIDLDDIKQLQSLGKFDSICLFRFKPNVALIEMLMTLLNEDGRLMISTFNYEHHLSCGFNAKFCLQVNEFDELMDRFVLVKKITSLQAPFTDTYIFSNQS